MSVVKRNRTYYKYEDDLENIIDLAKSSNLTYTNNSSFLVESVTAWSTEQTYMLNKHIKDKHFRIDVPSGWIQSNAGWTATVTLITTTGNVTLLSKDWGYAVTPSGSFEIDLPDYIEVKGVKIYVYCYRRSTSYCYGSIQLRLYHRNSYPINLERGEDVYEDWKQPVFANYYHYKDGVSYLLKASHNSQPAWWGFNDNRTTNDNCWWTNHGATSETTPVWIQLQSTKKLKLNSVSIMNEIYTNQDFKKCTLQVSNNEIDWEDIATIEGTNTAGYETTKEFTVSEGYYFYRLYFTEAFSTAGISIQNIEFKGEILKELEGTKADSDFYKDDFQLYDFIVPKKTYYRYGDELDVTTAGTFAKIEKGIAGTFANGRYLIIPEAFPEYDTFEIVYKWNIKSIGDVRIQGTTADFKFIHIAIATDGSIKWFISSNGSSWNVASQLTSGKAIPLNTDLWIKQEFDGTKYTLSTSLDGINYEEYTSVESTAKAVSGTITLGQLGYSNSIGGVDGSIDLSQSYININGERWWSGDSYTRIGSWIDGTHIQGFTGANYMYINKTFNPTDMPWEWNVKLTLGSNASVTDYLFGCRYISGRYGLLFGTYQSRFACWISSNGSSWNIVEAGKGSLALEPNKTYYVKIGWNGVEYFIDVSDDGVTYTRDYTKASTAWLHFSDIYIGTAWSLADPFDGSIDLRETNVKIKGKTWWNGTKAIEIPKDSITDGGQVKYYKNIVTTHYWKLLDWVQEAKPAGITATSGWGNYMNAFDQNSDTYATCGTKTDYIEWDFGTTILLSGVTGVGQFVSGSAECCNLVIKAVEGKNEERTLGTTKGANHSSYYKAVTNFGLQQVSKIRIYLTNGDDYSNQPPSTAAKTRIREITLNANQQIMEGTENDYTYTTQTVEVVEVTANDEYDFTETVPAEDIFYIQKIIPYTPVAKSGKSFVTYFESAVGGDYSVTLNKDSLVRITCIGGGGAAAMKGVYDDRGYGWTGGSGGGFIGTFQLSKGTYGITVGSANNNTKGQGGNTNTMNPSDTSTHDSYITGIVRVGGGGAGTTSGVGAAGKAATLDIEPLSIELNTAGNAGAYGSGGKGSGANWTHNGAASVYKGYGKGQGCSTSEYASRRYWIAGTAGYIKIDIWSESEKQIY